MQRIAGIAAAKMFVDAYYPDCLAAVLCGSVARYEATPTSDLDILIVVRQEIEFYRKTFREYDWSIEVFVGSAKYNEEKIHRPSTNHTPLFLTSWAEGIILKDENNFAHRQRKASEILKQDPEPLTQQAIDQYRYPLNNSLHFLYSIIIPK